MMKTKRSQILILSAMFLFLLLLFTYSLETDNTYISKISKNTLLDNLMFETCQVGKLSNGTYIQSRFSNFSSKVQTYCQNIGRVCQLTIVNNTAIPSNLSKLNYTYFDYKISYTSQNFSYTHNFTC